MPNLAETAAFSHLRAKRQQHAVPRRRNPSSCARHRDPSFGFVRDLTLLGDFSRIVRTFYYLGGKSGEGNAL